MNRALKPMTDEERAREEAMIQRILHEVQHFESEERESRMNPIAIVVLTYAAALCVVVAWVVVGTM